MFNFFVQHDTHFVNDDYSQEGRYSRVCVWFWIAMVVATSLGPLLVLTAKNMQQNISSQSVDFPPLGR